jgi:hypothetical protein
MWALLALTAQALAAQGPQPLPPFGCPDQPSGRPAIQQCLERALDQLDPLLFRLDAPAEAWYQAGRAKLELAGLEAVPRWRDHQRPGTTYAEGARLALLKALSRDPAHTGAATLLAQLHWRTRGTAGTGADLDLIRAAGPRAAALADTAYWLARIRSELEWEHPDSALAAADRYAEAGGDPSIAAAERARALFALGQVDDGAAAWFDGLALAHGAAMAAYRADLAWVAGPDELAAFDSLPAEFRPDWARRFWERRAVADFRSVPERLAEHFARTHFAAREFRLTDTERDFNSAMPYRSDQDLVDDRGVIWVRHGPPDEVVESGAGEGVGCGYVSWVYRHGADAGLSVHFRTWFSLAAYRSWRQFCSGRRDYRLVPGGPWIDHHAWWMAERDSLYNEWAHAVSARRYHVVARLEREIESVELRHLEVAVSTDGDPHRFARNLGALVLAWPLGDPGRLLVVYGIPAAQLTAVDPVARLRLAALPARGVPLMLAKTLAFDPATEAPPDGLHLGFLELPAAAGSWELRSLVTTGDPELGSGGAQPGLDVPSATGPGISAFVLGNPRSGLLWNSPAGEFPLSPSLVYGRDDEVAVYLEARGLAPAPQAEVRMRVHPAAKPDRALLELRTVEPLDEGRLALSRTIGLERLKPGTYVLAVEISGPAAEPLQRRQWFTVR